MKNPRKWPSPRYSPRDYKTHDEVMDELEALHPGFKAKVAERMKNYGVTWTAESRRVTDDMEPGW